MSRKLLLMFWFNLTLSIILFQVNVSAQKIKKEDYFPIDAFVQKAGPMKGFGLQYIVDSISKECATELQMTRAFYYWQTHFLSFDFKRKKHPDYKDDASTALMERKAASLGFARMFASMCALKKIDCKIIKGVLRYRIKDINQFDKDELHYWNIVSINNTQYLIDVSLGMGNFDEKGKHLYKQFTDAWWLSNRKLFASTHFPDDKSNQLLEVPITKNEFAQGPIVAASAIVLGILPSKSAKGIIKGVAGDSTILKFNFVGKLNVRSLEAVLDNEQRINLNYDFDEFGFYITVPNGKEGEHILKIFCNNSLVFAFKTDMRKARKIATNH